MSLAAGDNAEVVDSGPARVLLVEDNPGDADLVREALDGDTGNWQIDHVWRLADAVSSLQSRSADVVLLDLALPDASGLQGVTQLVSLKPDVPLVVLTGMGDPDAGTRAVQQGAQEYLLKSELDRRVLGRVLRYSIERHAASQRSQLLAREQAARLAAEESRRRALLLAEASIAVGSTLEEGRALARLAHALVPRFAACCAVARVDVDGHGRCLVVVEASSGTLAELDLRTTDRLTIEALRASCTRGARMEEPAPEPPAGWSDAWGEAVRGLGLRAAAVAPLRVRDEALGTLTLGTVGRYHSDDLALAEEIARRVSTAIESARLHAQALDAVQVRDNFLSIASHDLRNPLHSITLDARLIQLDKQACSDEVRRGLQRIARNAERLRALVDELLDVSRIRAGRLPLDLSDVELGALVREVAYRNAPALASAGSELRLSTAAPVHGRWDRSRVQQVVSNLLQNAVRYGGGKPIDLVVEGHGDSASVRVSDQGPGIDPRDQRRIFEQFGRGSGATKTEGLGLGLWIARKIVEAHGGLISVESEPGRGANFRVELPCSGPTVSATAL